MAAILDFTRNAITKVVYVLATLWQTCFETSWYTPTLWFCFYFIQNDTNLLYYLAQIAAILDFNNNPMSKVLSDYITMSGITKTLMLHNNIKNLHQFCQKYYYFIVSSCTNGGHITLDVDIFRRLNPLSPHDALKHHFTSLKTDLIFLQLRVLEEKFPWNWITNTWQFFTIFHSLQVIFIHYTAIRGL